MRIENYKSHYHGNHGLVVSALKAVAFEVGVNYSLVKQDFIAGCQDCTFLFWKHFYEKNPYKTLGVDYCHSCRKFILLFEEPRKPWTLLHDLEGVQV
jgi:hypothetical protein